MNWLAKLVQVEAQKLRLGPGDVLLIGMAPGTKAEIRDSYIEGFRKVFPHNQVVIVDKNVKFHVVSSTTAKEIEDDLRALLKGLE